MIPVILAVIVLWVVIIVLTLWIGTLEDRIKKLEEKK